MTFQRINLPNSVQFKQYYKVMLKMLDFVTIHWSQLGTQSAGCPNLLIGEGCAPGPLLRRQCVNPTNFNSTHSLFFFGRGDKLPPYFIVGWINYTKFGEVIGPFIGAPVFFTSQNCCFVSKPKRIKRG